LKKKLITCFEASEKDVSRQLNSNERVSDVHIAHRRDRQSKLLYQSGCTHRQSSTLW